MNEIKEHLKAYRSELVSIVKKGDFNEHTFRTPLENLLNALKPKDIRLTHEPKAEQGQGSVRPDFKIYKQTPHYEALQGFIECKNYKENLDTLVKGKQIEKYLAVCPNIILTDYNRFILLSFGKVIADITLFPFGLENALFTQEKAKDIEIQNAFIQLLQSFFESVANITNKDELVAILSTQSFYLSETIFKSDEAGLLNTQFKESFEKAFATFASLENTTFSKIEFCDILAQSVVYGMFVAYIENDEFEIDKIPIQSFIQLLPQHFLTLQEFVYYSLPFFALPENIKYALENVKKTIALIDKPSLATSFEKEIQSLSIYLYEDFLKAYDTLRGEQRRKEGGVFYTPQPVVNMIVSSLNELLQSKFDKKGFNDESVKVLDFATGTGSFLAKVFELILANESEVFAKELIINKCLKDIYGFELSFVPYIVAHLKLSSILRQKGFSDLNLTHKFQIFLTNTLDLDGDKQIQMQVPFDSLKGQRDEALKLKRQEDLLVILGNPPYNVKSKNKGDEIVELLKAYKKGFKGKTNLDDDYIKFIRFAQWKLLEQNQKQGLMGFITNNSFLDGRTHRKMRQSLARAFDEIYILNLHGDSGDENVFDIRVGVCISLFVKYKEIDTSGDSKSPLPCKEQTKNSPSLAEGARGWVKTSNNPSHRPLAPYMKEFSRVMRKNPTQAENKLWQELRGKKLGFGFRRQFVIDSKYIADFVCLEKRLIIECDGGQHNQNFDDIERNFYLESQNFRILRFWNNEILENLEGVLSVIKEALNDDNFASAKFTHPLTPSAREGEQDKNSIKAPPLAGGVGEGYPYAKVLYYSTNDNGILKRNDKFALLNSIAQNGLNSVKWQELKLDEPYFWFVPKSFENDEYENFWALARDKALSEQRVIFEIHNSGIQTKRDNLIYDTQKENLIKKCKTAFKGDFDETFKVEYDIHNSSSYTFADKLKTLKFDENSIYLAHYRPFDKRFIYYKIGFTARPSYEVMKHFLQGENLGLCFPKNRLSPNSHYGLVVDTLADVALGGAKTGSETYIAPLYRYDEATGDKEGEVGKIKKNPNFTPEFKEFIIKSKVLKDKSEEQILAFIYANLFNPAYRKKYLEYLKIGFPRVNFEVNEGEFETFAKIGQRLIDLHLLKNIPNDESIALKFSDKADKQKPNFTLEKPRFIDDKIMLNDDLEIVGIAKSIFEFSIGGYKVLDKWLKYRVGKALSKAELEHLVNVACIIKETIKIQNELENLAQKDKK